MIFRVAPEPATIRFEKENEEVDANSAQIARLTLTYSQGRTRTVTDPLRSARVLMGPGWLVLTRSMFARALLRAASKRSSRSACSRPLV